jgi:N-methylhydantoinase A
VRLERAQEPHWDAIEPEGDASRYSIAADVGGTFTDVVSLDHETGALLVGKSPTTALKPASAIRAALGETGVRLAEADRFFHGTTLGVNTLLERRGARVGLLTSAGFRDLLEIGRATWPPYRLTWSRPAPLAPRSLCRDVAGRILFDGTILEELDESAVERAARELVAEGVDAIAICFLGSYAHPVFEQRAAAAIVRAGLTVPLVLSHELSRRYGEHERAVTALGEAYIRPKMRAYFQELERGIEADGFGGRLFVTSSDAGVMGVAQARERTLRTLVSGCASGIAGAATVGRSRGWDNVIAIDMGGTSFDAGIVRDGTPAMTTTAHVAGFEFLMPMVELATIGAGGGSIAWLDSAGGLDVGPQSAGADPGPACYGRGGSFATFTDAAVVSGLLPDSLLGGAMSLRADLAAEVIERTIAKPLGLEVVEAASGIISLVEAKMARTIEDITVGRGVDPREFVLFAYGGGGPVVACALAAELAIPRVVIPPHPGVFSAWGMQTLDIVHDFSATVVRNLPESDDAPVSLGEFAELYAQAQATLEREGILEGDRLWFRTLEMRYDGQEHTLPVSISGVEAPTAGELRERFSEQHQLAYGFVIDGAVQVVACGLRAVGLLPDRGRESNLNVLRGRDSSAGAFGRRLVTHRASAARAASWPLYRREELAEEAAIDGPAIVEEFTSTIVIPPRWIGAADGRGNLILESRAA